MDSCRATRLNFTSGCYKSLALETPSKNAAHRMKRPSVLGVTSVLVDLPCSLKRSEVSSQSINQNHLTSLMSRSQHVMRVHVEIVHAAVVDIEELCVPVSRV